MPPKRVAKKKCNGEFLSEFALDEMDRQFEMVDKDVCAPKLTKKLPIKHGLRYTPPQSQKKKEKRRYPLRNFFFNFVTGGGLVHFKDQSFFVTYTVLILTKPKITYQKLTRKCTKLATSISFNDPSILFRCK